MPDLHPTHIPHWRPAAALLCAALTVSGCADGSNNPGKVKPTSGQVASLSSQTSPATAAAQTAPRILTPHIVREHPFNNRDFIEGLDVTPDGNILVSTGLNGQSRIYTRTVDGAESNVQPLPAMYFGAGTAVHKDTAWQLSWQQGVAFHRHLRDLSPMGDGPEGNGQFHYDGEGWGLCANDRGLVMSNGSGELTFRDPETFHPTGQLRVTLQGQPTSSLNELDCGPDGRIWANVWQTNLIYGIDATTGAVTDVVDTTGTLPAATKPGVDVLNGIAHIPGTDRFYITGKNWDTLYEVTFEPK
ncbi:glutaminyl-peptide cyclotransferase [Corynebacterium heidelbergense]|uniref:Glutamine cyclotransferase n=1 Tax=Corynebacterium heidelbergense TaxID=2055947 RepID=A0A364VCA7_9CORY|nr:glutaminyl-peptide cyclotransferase [Corynebacterium heidelbergense]RAV34283.1 glutamine cyclotransferase [Corynebacterium heidelbergense]